MFSSSRFSTAFDDDILVYLLDLYVEIGCSALRLI